eukprot:scaffold19670_cov88-Isochrysis_galbana.AAC.1
MRVAKSFSPVKARHSPRKVAPPHAVPPTRRKAASPPPSESTWKERCACWSPACRPPPMSLAHGFQVVGLKTKRAWRMEAPEPMLTTRNGKSSEGQGTVVAAPVCGSTLKSSSLGP